MRRAALCAAVLGLLAAGAEGAPAHEPIALAPAGVAEFPQRSYRLTVTERRGLRADDVSVTENGAPVRQLSLASADGRRVGAFGTILVIDASSSMRGPPFRGALAAARALARQRSGVQQLGVIAFNRGPEVMLAPTSDGGAIARALSMAPTLAPQTRIFDAVATALDLLERARIAAGSIVVLSDGSDTGSRATAREIGLRARRANVAIYTVGLRSRAFDGGELEALAAAGRGRYTPAGTIGDLRRIFGDLGVQLAGDSLVRYRSLAPPGSRVTVAVRVRGVDGLATSVYRAPGDALSAVRVEPGFWTSGLGLAATGGLCALLLAVGLGAAPVLRRRGPTVRERIAGFASVPGAASRAEDAMITGRPRGGAERSLERTRWWAAFTQDVEIADIAAEPIRIATLAVCATLAAGFVLVAMTGIPAMGLLALGVPWAVRTWVRARRDRQRALFVEQLPDILQGAASAVRAGHGLVAALALVAEDASEPGRSEVLRVVADEALGVALEDALVVVQRRMDSREVLQIALVAQIQRDAGGNMAEVLDRITETLRQAADLRRTVKALTAQGRLSRWVVTALPVVLLLVISVINPQYVRPLFTETLGLVLLVAAGALMTAGSLVIGKIVDFKV